MSLRREPADALRWWVRPFVIFEADLPPNLVLMAKLIAVGLLLQRELPISRPFLPFLPIFDRVGSPGVLHAVLVLLFLTSSVALLFSRHARAACVVLGSTILISIIGSRPTFTNNLTYCGALLFLLGLQPQQGEPRLLRLQVVLLYLGAGLNKLLDPDWRSGQFFEYWFGHVHSHHWYLGIASQMPPLLLSKIISFASFCTELGLAAMLLVRRLFPLAIWIGLAWHTSMLVMTNATFHMFFYAACASFFAFVSWPTDPLTVLYDHDSTFCRKMKSFYQHIDLEERYAWLSSEGAANLDTPATGRRDLTAGFQLTIGEKRYDGFTALKMLLLYNPLPYFLLLVALRAPDVLHQRRWIAAGVLLLFSPIFEPLAQRLLRFVSRDRQRSAHHPKDELGRDIRARNTVAK
jgi:hypothetical protein